MWGNDERRTVLSGSSKVGQEILVVHGVRSGGGKITEASKGRMTKLITKDRRTFKGADAIAFRHGHAAKGEHSSTYRAWCSMRTRCLNPNRKTYVNYGGRGISVCERWNLFENFLADMGERPEGRTLDRFPDPNGNYEPSNCRWATPQEQANNTRRNKWITHGGITDTQTGWARRVGITVGALRSRLKTGRPLSDVLTTKYRPNHKPLVGGAHPKALLTNYQAAEIKRRAIAGEAYQSLAQEFGVGFRTVGMIKRGESWKCLG